MTARGGDRTVAAPRARRGWPAILVSVVLATAFTSFAAPTASAHDDPWDDDDSWQDDSWQDDSWQDDSWQDDSWQDDPWQDDSWQDDPWQDDPWQDDDVASATTDEPGAPIAGAAVPTEPLDTSSTTWTTQDADVSGTAVAIADTGGNVVAGEPAAPTTVVDDGQQVQTGTADATGSLDRTSITQDATVTLEGDASAEIVQFVIVFNVGAAAASTGSNAVAGPVGPGVAGGGVTTGDATAIGNDGTVMVVQAAASDAAPGAIDGSDQQTFTVRIGVAVARTGGNDGAGGAGPITTGDATAIGNDATTDVRQVAVAGGDGAATITIDQRAFVLNVGVALANTGANGAPLDASVTQAAGGFLDTPDETHARELLTLLFPSLLAATTGTSTGTGAVTTGDATAIGNRSTTSIDQSATATAAGDGSAVVGQQVVVANMGIAIADTGSNGTSVGSDPGSDPAAAQAITAMAAFVSQLMSDLQQWDGSSELLGRGLTLDIGGRTIVLDGALAGRLLTSDPSSPQGQRTVRQLSAVINLGIAVADSGHNSSGAASTAPQVVTIAPASSGQVGAITLTTGDANASNVSVVLICQRDDRPDAMCPRPPVTSTPGAPGAAAGSPVPSTVAPAVLSAGLRAEPGASDTGALPMTGGDPSTLVVAAATALFVGLLARRTSRRTAMAPSAPTGEDRDRW